MNKDFLELGQRWFECINRNDLDGVVGLYDDRATFHPTLSGEFIQNTKDVRRYFVRFLSMNPQIIVVKFDLRELLETAFVFSGVMNIDIAENGEQSTIHARFTFVWKLNEDRWRIAHHHNSVVPE